MPNRTVYIWEDNLSYWNQLKDKSKEINEWLITKRGNPNGESAVPSVPPISGSVTPKNEPKPNIASIPSVFGHPIKPAAGICQHGWPLQTCPDARCNKKARDRGLI
jgi:hypothetical protein